MSNETNLPVYSVPGTAGNPDLYYLRSFSSLPDTEITKEQFDGVNGDFIAATAGIPGAAPDTAPGPIPEATLVDLHANQDPAANTPAAAGTPIEAAAATPAAVPAPADQPVESEPAITASDNPPADQAGADPNVSASSVSGNTDSSSAPSQTEPGNGPAEAQTEEVPAAEPGTTEASPASDTPAPGTDPGASNENTGDAGVADPGAAQAETSSPAGDSGTAAPTASTDQVVATINNLPGDVSPEGVVTDPTTGQPVDLTDHPVAADTTNLSDPETNQPIIAVPPPSSVAPEDHASWWAKEKQRLINWLRDEANSLEADLNKGETEAATDLTKEADSESATN